jgi:hypothetical protein
MPTIRHQLEGSSLQSFKEREDDASQLNRLAGCSKLRLYYKVLRKIRRREALAELSTAAQVLASS